MDPAILARVKASLGDDVDVLLAKKLARVGRPARACPRRIGSASARSAAAPGSRAPRSPRADGMCRTGWSRTRAGCRT
jgi:hypothetical protein